MGGKTPTKPREKGVKKRIKKLLRPFKNIHTWQLLLVLIPLLFVAATLLRLDHLKMVELRTAVIEADKALGTVDQEGSTLTADAALSNLQTSLDSLRDFTFKNIVVNVSESNGIQSIIFGTGPFYLEQLYLRDANRAIAEAEGGLVDDSNPNGNIYAAVAAICQPQAIAHGWLWSSPEYLDCWTSELEKYPTSEALISNAIIAAVPPTELYRRSYASPVWAPTITGFVLLACAILAVVIIVRFFIWVVLKLALLFLDRD